MNASELAVVDNDRDDEALVPVSEVEDLVREAVRNALQEAHIPSLLKPRPRRVGIDDPAIFGFPPTLPIELALGDMPRNEILKAYEITPAYWDVLRNNVTFRKALSDAVEKLQREGMSFRVKAQMQSEALLETSFKMIHDKNVPHNVRADLIKTTYKVAGLEPKESASAAVGALQINIHL